MIKKLKLTGRDIYENTALAKINELVDAVNGILDYAPLEMAQKAEKDPYAEQRKWIGILCRFWDGNKTPTQTTDFAYGTLLEIDDYGDFKCNTMTWFDNCEPVKPDDDIIYKGGKDEH